MYVVENACHPIRQLFAGFAAGPLAAWAYPFLRETAAELINGDQHLGANTTTTQQQPRCEKMWNIFNIHANHIIYLLKYMFLGKCEIYNGCSELIMGSCLCFVFLIFGAYWEI